MIGGNKMFIKTTPEAAGVPSSVVKKFFENYDKYAFSTHAILMARGNKLFAEKYYKPFDENFLHRMYSISKSFVSLAVGFCIEDGLLSLQDKFMKFFPECKEYECDNLNEVTIEDMLTMSTAVEKQFHWFCKGVTDRVPTYFKGKPEKIPGTLFEYDSPGSFMLCVIVEKLVGKPFLEYLKEKCLDDIGFSKEAYCLKAPGGYSFGDSGVMCTSMDLLKFARFVMNKGEWNGKKYFKTDYLEKATSKMVCNNRDGFLDGYEGYGYGYQIWKAPRDGFAFVGMGDQFAVCDFKTDFIFIINSDNQGSSASRPIFYNEIYNHLIPEFCDSLAENEKEFSELKQNLESGELAYLSYDEENPFIDEINGVTYKLDNNPMEIEWIKFDFDGKKGIFSYKNKQGEKTLPFGMGYNEFSLFPEEGCADLIVETVAPGNKYRCAVSADFAEEKKLRLKVQIIDKYFGNSLFVFSFKDRRVMVSMRSHAEAFLKEYIGLAKGEKANE